VSTTPKVHVGPSAPEVVVEAVRRGGAEVVAAQEAEAVVWLGGPDGLGDLLHDGVRWVQLPSAGVEGWLDSGVVDDRRVWTSATGAYAQDVAEHALALLLAGRRRLAECARARRWEQEDLAGRPLPGATVAVVGAGGIGRALLAMLAPLGVRTIAVTRSGREVPGADESVPAERLDAVWPRADVVVVAAPATSWAPPSSPRCPRAPCSSTSRAARSWTPTRSCMRCARAAWARRPSTSPTPSRCPTATRCGTSRARS
jgi:D-3-phosphoglycerate dehydrogenase